MKKWIKITASFLAIIVLIPIFAFILLITLVNPNRFKPFITDQVQKYTGRQLTMEGNLSWSFYPYLGVKVGHTELNNPSGFQQKVFAELDSGTVGVKVAPLFSAKIESSGLALNGLKLNLIRNADGTTNWQDLQTPSAKNSNPAPTTAPTASRSKAAMIVAITGVDVTNATINWIDLQAKQNTTVDQLSFHAKDITANRPFPITAEFHFSGKNPDMSGKFDFTTSASFNQEKQLYRFREIEFSAQIQQAEKNYKINSTASLVVDGANQTAEFSDWKGDFADIHWTGKLEIKNLNTQPVAMGYIQTHPFVLQDVLTSLGQKASDVPKANKVKADLNFTFDTAKVTSALQKITLQGVITASDFQAQKVKATNLIAHIQLENGVLNLSSLSAVFYQGNLQGDAKINLNNANPDIALNAKLTHVQAEPLLTDLINNSQLKFSGASDLDLQITTIGTDKNVILHNLNGTAKLSVSNGTLKGIDIAYLANAAFSIAKGKSPSMKNEDQTKFGNLTANAVIHNGVIQNDDLLLSMQDYTTSGKGNIDLVNQQINYSLGTKAKHDPESSKSDLLNLYGLTIPMKITGNLNHPNVGLDTADLTKQIAELQLQRGKEKIKDQISKAIPGDAGKLLKNLLGN